MIKVTANMIKYNNNSIFHGDIMAKPRVFISSTYYDLKQVRNDIERFIKDIGYESVRNETGSIPYGQDASPEEGCYREIENADIVVSIIGGKFGTLANDNEKSISQKELAKALIEEKQVFIFIDKAVEAEYQFYKKNIEKKELFKQLNLNVANDIRIFEHIDSIRSLEKNNAISTFESSYEIVGYLKEQFAGLFQRFLKQQKQIKEINLIDQLSNTATSLQSMVDYLSKTNESHNETINELVLSNHPAMQKIKEVTNIKHRVFFLSFDELDSLLTAYGYKHYVSAFDDPEFEHIWKRNLGEGREAILNVSSGLFDDNNKLKPINNMDWNDDFIRYAIKKQLPPRDLSPDDIPF